MNKSKIFRILSGSFIVLFACVAMSCSKSSDQVKDDDMLATSDSAAMAQDDANLGAGSSGRGK